MRAQWLLRRADSLGGYGVERSRARAQWLLSGGEDRRGGRVLIREALQNVILRMLTSISSMESLRPPFSSTTAAAIGAFRTSP